MWITQPFFIKSFQILYEWTLDLSHVEGLLLNVIFKVVFIATVLISTDRKLKFLVWTTYDSTSQIKEIKYLFFPKGHLPTLNKKVFFIANFIIKQDRYLKFVIWSTQDSPRQIKEIEKYFFQKVFFQNWMFRFLLD